MPLTFKLYKITFVFSFQMQQRATACVDDKCLEESTKYIVLFVMDFRWKNFLGFYTTFNDDIKI